MKNHHILIKMITAIIIQIICSLSACQKHETLEDLKQNQQTDQSIESSNQKDQSQDQPQDQSQDQPQDQQLQIDQSIIQANRGPSILSLDGDANGLWWDEDGQILYIADDNNNRILKWTDQDGFGLVANLPSASSQRSGLGQLVKMQDGTIVVTRFGAGEIGDVAYVTPTGEAKIVNHLNVERRRIGLCVSENGTLYDSWYVRLSSGARVGAVGELSLSGTEPEIVSGLSKPVGVLAFNDHLYISDQVLGQILKAPIDHPDQYEVFATIDRPDLMAKGPNGSILMGSTNGNVLRVESNGQSSIFQSGFQQVRGIAYDPRARRLFIAEHDPDESDGIEHRIHIVPMDE
jgi:hypothetical protein